MDEWLTAEQAADLLGVPEHVIYRLVGEELPALRWPVRIRRSALESFIERSRVGRAAEGAEEP